MRKPLSQPAFFSLPRMEPLLGSNRARFSASFRSKARFSAPCPFRFPRLVFVAGYVQYPMQPVLNSPMAPHNVVAPFRRESLAQQVVPGFLAGVSRVWADRPSAGRYLAHGLQTGPVMPFLQPGDVVADAGNAGFDTPVTFVDLGSLSHRRGRVVQKQLHVIVQTALVPFQSQRVVSALINHPVSGHGAGSVRRSDAGSAWRRQ